MATHTESSDRDFGYQQDDVDATPVGTNKSINGEHNAHVFDKNHLDHPQTQEALLRRIRTSGSIVSLSPELFEKLYLSPKTPVKGDLRYILGNPTPVAILGFLMSLTPVSCDLMGWRGSGGEGASEIAACIFFGGVLMLTGGFVELVLGNTFPCVVFMSFGSFYLTYGGTLQPFYGTYAAYSPSPSDPAAGLQAPMFNASYAFFYVFFTVLVFFYFICSLRTNFAFAWIFFTVVAGLGCIDATFFYIASAQTSKSSKTLVAGGACFFAACMGGWYLLLALLLPSVDFPFSLPVGDLSSLIPSAAELKKRRKDDKEDV